MHVHRITLTFLLFILLFAFPCSVSSVAQTPVADGRLGFWGEVDGSRVLLLEEKRSGWLEEQVPRFYRTTYSSDGAIFESWGTETQYVLRMKGDQLHVVGTGKDLMMKRLAELPDELLVTPYELPPVVEMDADIVESLEGDLQERRKEDQRVRRVGGSGNPDEMRRVDADNTEFLRDIIAELGWVDAVRFGVKASNAAFILVQHTNDLRLMRTALPLIERDVLAGRLNGANFALLYDRLQLNLGYLQRYGSQIGVANGRDLLMPCEDIGRVDEFRATMGLGKLSEYLSYFRSEGEPPIHHIGTGQYGEK